MNDKQTKLVEHTKYLVGELSNMQELYFEALIETLKVIDGQEDWLFDFIFNESDVESFEKYLDQYGKSIEDIIHE